MTRNMKTITVKPNQTIHDIAVEQYGTCEAVPGILENNPGIRNDKEALKKLGIDYLDNPPFYIDAPVEVGLSLQVDTSSRLIKNSVTREITSDVTTFDL